MVMAAPPTLMSHLYGGFALRWINRSVEECEHSAAQFVVHQRLFDDLDASARSSLSNSRHVVCDRCALELRQAAQRQTK